MRYQYPHTIENGGGERLTFLRVINDPQGKYLEVENSVSPGAGPPMHVHFFQEESLTVVKGKMGVALPDQRPLFYTEGQTGCFAKGIPHRFWNAGDEMLICRGYIKPAHNIEYFLTELFKSTKENGGKRPRLFDSVFLVTRYKTEFDMLEIPSFVKQFVFPIILLLGKLAGWHKKFADAPEPVVHA